MKNRFRMRVLLAVGGLALAGAAVSPSAADGQSVRRMGKWQFNIPITFTNGGTLEGQGDGFIEVSDDVGWGFGFGYHLNQRLMLGFESTWLRASYSGEIEFDDDGDQDPEGITRISGKLDAASFLAVGQFNILERTRFTPFVTGKLGWTYTDSNIPNAPPQGGCWWDPWWGYVCDVWQSTYSSWDFSYGGGVGVRAQLSPSFFLEGSYNALWVDYDRRTPRNDGFRLSFGWMN